MTDCTAQTATNDCIDTFILNYTMMNEAIRIAISKGKYVRDMDYTIFDTVEERVIIAQDPLFWQALGKALGWDKHNKFLDPSKAVNTFIGYDTWLYYAEKYFRLVLTGGDTEKFWKELLNKHDNDTPPANS